MGCAYCLWPFVKSKVGEIIGPMRRLELQAEWRTVWYGTRGKFRCLSHKACMLTLNSESRHQKCFSCDVCGMCCAWVLSVSFGVCVSVCAFRSSYRWRCCKSPAFDCMYACMLDCSYTNISNISNVFSEWKIQGMPCLVEWHFLSPTCFDFQWRMNA